jgi:ribonuclease HI
MQERLRIKQQNVKHSKVVTDTLITDTSNQDFDILLIQEPYIYPGTNLTPTSRNWIPILPNVPHATPPRSVILISALLPTTSYEQLPVPTELISAINIRTDSTTLSIYNIYNPPQSNAALIIISTWLRDHPPDPDFKLLIAGDFNKHHPLWTHPERQHLCLRSDADLVLQLMQEQDLKLVTEPGTRTFESEQHRGAWSTLDLTFCSSNLLPYITSCVTSFADCIPSADHFPIHTVLDIPMAVPTRTPGHNFKEVDWTKFNASLREILDRTVPAIELDTPERLDHYVNYLTTALQQAIDKNVPRHRICSKSKRWWTPALSALRKEYAKAARLEYETRTTDRWHLAKARRNEVRNKYIAAVRKTKNEHWKTWLENIDEHDIWVAGKFAKNPLSFAGTAPIPTLHQRDPNGNISRTFDTAEAKAEALRKLFFPSRPANLPSLNGDDGPFPSPLPFTPPKLHQVIRRIQQAKPFKAPGDDGIPNIVLQRSVDIIAPHLHQCLLATLRLNYFPERWRTWRTIVLRKPGRSDYSMPKAYRPIALYNTMSKILSGVITDVATYLTVRHSLLPSQHFGGLPGRTTTDSLLYLTHKIKAAWRKRKVVTIIFLDIANAFPNAVTSRLLLNMRKMGYPTAIVNFFSALLTDRHTYLSFEDFTSSDIPIDNGIGQGEPASMLLYLIYNSPLVAIPEGPDEDGGAYVDDTFFMATADTFEQCDVILNNMLRKQRKWSDTHNSKAETSKFQCLRLTRKKTCDREDFICTDGSVIHCIKQAKLLGIILDEELRWHTQVSNAVCKGTKLLLAIARLTRPSFGLPYRYTRRLFISMVLPKVEYALPVWYVPPHITDTGRRLSGSVRHAKELAKIQRLGCKLLTGAFKCTATDLLDIHAFLPPLDLRLEVTYYREALRLASLPKSHSLHPIVKSSARRQPRSHLSPIHLIFKIHPIQPDHIETLDPVRCHPSWQPLHTHHIAANREDAITALRSREDELKIYSDGSGLDGMIGAAATVGVSGGRSLRFQLGKETEHTVFEAELVGVLLALHLLGEYPQKRSILIAIDNQAAIRALTGNSRQPGQYLLDAILNRMQQLKRNRRHLTIHLEWSPGHEGIQGNEVADRLAKRASAGDTSNNSDLPPLLRHTLPLSTAALKMHFKKSIATRWAERWATSPRFMKMSRIDATLPSHRTLRLFSKLSRRAASILIQLRSGHIALNVYLKKIKAMSTPLCLQCGSPETVAHFLLHCHRFVAQRRLLRQKAGRAANSLPQLLSNPKIIPHTLRYIAQTRRLKDYIDIDIDNETG